MKVQRNGRLKKSVTLMLILALALSLIVAGSAEHWSNNPTIPTETRNTDTVQVDTVSQLVTFGQKAAWTDVGNGEAKVELSFDGAEYVMKEIKGYDFAIILDGSGSANVDATKTAATTFAANMFAQNSDAHFTVIRNDINMDVLIENSNNLTAIQTAIDNIAQPVSYNADYVAPSCEVAYALHKATGRTNKLMIVIMTDGDFCSMPSMYKGTGYSFTTEHRGDTYTVEASGALRGSHIPDESYTSSIGVEYFPTEEGFSENQTKGVYTITKNGVPIYTPDTNNYFHQWRATWAKILFMHEYTQKPMREDGVIFATICTTKYTRPNLTYAQLVAQECFGNFSPRQISDPGFCFELNGNTAQDYLDAFSDLETTITTKVVKMSTTIDNRYFTVDETALAASLPADCTYEVQNTTRGGVAVQDVEIFYQMDGEQTLDVSVSVPITINADIPKSAFVEGTHLPVVYDGGAPDGVASCKFVDTSSANVSIHTKQVYINASAFLPEGFDDDLFEATAENVILCGHWDDESSGYVVFWVSYDGAPITQDHLDYLTTACAPALHWKDISREFHTKGAAALTGVTDGIYAQVKVAVNVNASGVSAIKMAAGNVELATGYVITPGDVSAIYGTINAADQGAMTRVINNMPGTVFPQKGLANNFDFEMMDMNKDNLINAADIGQLSRIVNQIDWIKYTL